ncbi:MAG: hypothetical protein HYY04_10380 [Chloroflexi bacterium]|nr:hypothetical protein [Chloroflexota bacterium]
MGLVGNSRDVLRALIPTLQRNQDRSFLEEAQRGMKDWWQLMEERPLVHANEDDQVSDPAGNSGSRVACRAIESRARSAMAR